MENLFATAAQILGLLFFTIILIRTEPAINRMSDDSPPMIIRLSLALLATSAVAGILCILAGKVPEPYTLILAAGTAAFTLCERRIRLLTRPRNQKKGLRHAPR